MASNNLLVGPDVRSNDVGIGLTVTPIVNGLSAQGGTVNMQANGIYTYQSALNFSGLDTFSYTVTDSSSNSTTAIVTINVLPVAQNDIGFTNANTTLNGSTVFTNDIGQGLVIVAYDATSFQGGTILTNTLTGTYTYNPPLNFSGIDTFTYSVQDTQGNITVATVTITVLPVSFNDTATGIVNIPLVGASVLANDIGTGLVVLTFVGSTVQGGTVTMNSDGSYTYQPPANFSGSDSFTYTAQDLTGNQTTAQVVITIFPDANNITAITNANTTLIGSSVFSGASGTSLTITSFQNPSIQGGFVSMNTNGTYTYIPPLNFSGIDTFNFTVQDFNGNTDTATVTITILPLGNNDNVQTSANTLLNGGSVLNNDIGTGLVVFPFVGSTTQGGSVNMNADGTYTYQPPANFSGSDSFTYTAQDTAGNQITAKVFITVLPTTNNVTATTNANTPLTGPSVLINASGTSLTVISFQDPSAQGGFVSMNTNGTYSYLPPLNFSGTDTFNFTVQDSEGNTATATVIIKVLPTGIDDHLQTLVNTPLNGENVLDNDSGTGLHIINYDKTSVNGGTVSMNADGTFVYIPLVNFTGIDTFTYTAQDDEGNSFRSTVFITVTLLAPPTNFKGELKICKLLNKKQYSINAKWSPSPSSSVVAYRIYLNGKLIKTISSTEALYYTICLKSKKSAYTIKITAIDALKSESPYKTIRIAS